MIIEEVFFKIVVFVGIVGITAGVQAQSGNVGINTSAPDPSAALDITATNRGLLPPRVALKGKSDTETVPRPATGLLVYNTSNSGAGSDAVSANKYYFFDGKTWAPFETDLGVLKVPQLAGYIYVVGRETFIDCGGGPTPLPFNFTDNKENLNSQIIERVQGDNYNFIVKKKGKLTVVGFGFFTNTGNVTVENPPNWIIGIQKSTNKGETWRYEAAQRAPYNSVKEYAISIPFSGTIEVNAGDFIRLAVGNTAGAKPITCKMSRAYGLRDSYGFTLQFYDE
ncbi:MAG: hypothetical protein FDW93_06015 [Bergeyella sp.]|nr:hypothetical protein [Bergeyella sp.]